MNGFAELPAALVTEIGFHVSIHFKRVGFELEREGERGGGRVAWLSGGTSNAKS